MDRPSDAFSRVGALKAAAAGKTAAAAGHLATACPYPAAGNLKERYLRRYWLRGHAGQAGRQASARL